MHASFPVLLHSNILVFSQLIGVDNTPNDRITWRVTDWPPFYIPDSEDKGQGIYDKLIPNFPMTLLAINIPD